MKSAKRLNRKLVKSRLTKKRRQVGRGGNDTYTLKFNDGKTIEINVNTDNTPFITNDSSIEILEPRLPTLEQYNNYATNFGDKTNFKNVSGTGLFVVNEDSGIEFYKLSNRISTKLKKECAAGNEINVEEDVHTTYINGMNITHTLIDATIKEPVLIPKKDKSFSRTGVIKRRTRKESSDNVSVNFEDTNAPVSSIGPASKEVFRTPGPPLPPRPSVRRSSSGSKRKSSSETNNRGVPLIIEDPYSTTTKKPPQQPPSLPPRKSRIAPYKGTGPSTFIK